MKQVTANYTCTLDATPISGTISFPTSETSESGISRAAEAEAKKDAEKQAGRSGEIQMLEISNLKTEDIDVNFNSSTGEDINSVITEKGQETTDDIPTEEGDPSIGTPNTQANDENLVNQPGENDGRVMHKSWDPRLSRIDEYFVFGETEADDKLAVRVPFASNTAATAFSDMANIMDAGVVQALINEGKIDKNSYIGQNFSSYYQSDGKTGQPGESSNTRNGNSGNIKMKYQQATSKIITHDTADFTNDDKFWGVQAIMNPYSLTKLVGGISKTDNSIINYMYDIRDQRRFYAFTEGKDILSISNPTVTELINWSNSDQWGRTPYSFQDFVYCKYFGLIPNNRLITLRRYTVPTYDNLQFESMFGDSETPTQNNTGEKVPGTENQQVAVNLTQKVFSPLAYVVTWFGGDTGNSLSSLMNFTTGINWDDLKADIWSVQGSEGESKQEVIDKMLGDGNHQGLFHSAEMSSLNKYFQGASMITAKITSLGKFALSMNKDIGLTQAAYDKLRGANVDPYEATYRNRVKGPINRIDSVKMRKPGIKFSQSLTIKCAYKAKAIGGINPKAALLDILGNCLEMVSPHAVFWGGGHRFEIHPRIYPFKKGTWRDSFMEKVYDGNFLGKDGAIATVLSGFKKVGTPDGGGGFSFDNLKGAMSSMFAEGMGLLGGAISSLSDMFGGSEFLDNLANKAVGIGGDEDEDEDEKAARLEAGKKKVGKLFSNLNNMWHNRMLEETTMPQISAQGNLLVGEPTGEWHLTIGNPLNPIMVIGNLICNDMKVTWDEEIGPDDFPTGFTVEYSLDHAMPRDNDAIQSMFNRGMGKFYTLPDYVSTSSDRITYVDKYTKDAGSGDTGKLPYKDAGALMSDFPHLDQTYIIDPGSRPKIAGNYNTQLITKFNPVNSEARTSIHDRLYNPQTSTKHMARVKALAATRKLINN